MNREQISVDDVIELLNGIITVDKPAMAALLANRVPCNEVLSDHPTIQVQEQHGGYHVGLLGIVNGMFGVDERGYGPICSEFEDGNLIRFKRTPKPNA